MTTSPTPRSTMSKTISLMRRTCEVTLKLIKAISVSWLKAESEIDASDPHRSVELIRRCSQTLFCLPWHRR